MVMNVLVAVCEHRYSGCGFSVDVLWFRSIPLANATLWGTAVKGLRWFT